MTTSYLHYENVDGSPVCGLHIAYPNEDLLIFKEPSFKDADRLGVDICDACLYINLRRVNHYLFYLNGLPKCQITRNNIVADTQITCELPQFIHEAHPNETLVHWNLGVGCWI